MVVYVIILYVRFLQAVKHYFSLIFVFSSKQLLVHTTDKNDDLQQQYFYRTIHYFLIAGNTLP